MTDYADKLHEKEEKPFGGQFRIVSMLDIMGATMTCDQCGRWQGGSALTEDNARRNLAAKGWAFVRGKDLCPICAPKLRRGTK